MPVLLGEKDVRAVLSMDDLIAAMETALDQFSAGGVRQPLRSIVDVGDGHAFYGVMPAFITQPAGARHQAGVGLSLERGARPAVAPRDDRPARSGDRRAAGGHGRALHHRSADGRGLGRVGEAPRAAGRARAGRARIRRAGAEPHRRADARPAVRRDPRLGTRRRARARALLERRAGRTRGARLVAAASARRGRRRRRRHRAGDGVARAGARARVGPRRRAHLRRRRLPSGSARDGHGARRATPASSSTRAPARSPRRAIS